MNHLVFLLGNALSLFFFWYGTRATQDSLGRVGYVAMPFVVLFDLARFGLVIATLAMLWQICYGS